MAPAASVQSVTASPGRHGPARAPARGSRFSLSYSPTLTGPGERLGPAVQSRRRTRPLPAPRPRRWRLDLLGWHCAGRALRTTPGALPEPHTPPLLREKDRGQGGEPSADRAAGPGLLARVPASGADSAGIFKPSLLGLAEREKWQTALGRMVHLRKRQGLPAS